jgi:hypothetical protein
MFLRDLPPAHASVSATLPATAVEHPGRRLAPGRRTSAAVAAAYGRRALRTPHSLLGEDVEVAVLAFEVLDRVHLDARVRAEARGRQLRAARRHG